MNKLTAKQLAMINRKLTDSTEDVSEKTKILVEEIARLPYEQNEMSLYKYKGIVCKASKLGCSIARIKPFAHKNNQTAVVAALTLLELNGIKLVDYEENVSQLVKYFLSGDIESGCEWFRRHREDSDIAEL